RPRLELLPGLAEALLSTGEYGEAAAVLDQAIEHATILGEPAIEAKATLIGLSVRQHTGELENWTEQVEAATAAAIALFEPGGDHMGLTKAWELLGYVHGNALRFGEMAAAFARALEHARLAGDAKQEARCATQYALALVHGPTPAKEAIARCEEIVAQVGNDRQAQATVLSCFAYL